MGVAKVISFFFRSLFFGDISPKDRPEFYIKCIHNVYQTYAANYKRKIPLIVNTQGWVRGEEITDLDHFSWGSSRILLGDLAKIIEDL